MLIEAPDELRKWLTSHLEPLCDADPNALAKYVLALIRKDKPIEELKSSMISQMDVFLQSETQNFVDMLFTIVDTKEYLKSNNSVAAAVEPAVTNIKIDKEKSEEKEKPIETSAGDNVEADSTTPVRENEKLPDPRPSFDDREDRKRSRPSPPGERRGHGRGPREYRDYQPRRFRSRSRSRSLSPRHDRFRSTRRRSRSPPGMRRSNDRHQPRRGRSAERVERDAGTPTRDEAGVAGYTPTVKPRCRDYDEKGFCLLGDSCNLDHGNDAIVLDDSRGYQPGFGEPYVPGIPTAAAGISYPPPIMSVPPPGYAPLGVKRGYDGGQGYEPPTKKFDYGRGGPRGRGRGGRGRGRGGFMGHHSSSMLAVRNIPVELNSILHLNSHFSKFGTLVNVQIQFEGDPSSALITFADTNEAAAAFNCTEAVLNNRFIKVFWHVEKQSAKERLGTASTPSNPNNVVLGEKSDKAAENEDTEKVKEEKEKAIQEIQKSQEMLQTKHEEMKKNEEQRKEALAKQETLLKSKHDLLDGLIEQQKMLISKLEKGRGTMKPEEKTKIMKLLKELTNSIDRTRQDIKTSLSVNGTKTKAEIQKDLLDAEMELFTKQQDGEDTTEIQQRVDNLRKEAARQGVSTRGARGAHARAGFRGARGRGGFFVTSPRGGVGRGRGRGRGFTLSPGANKLDRRPTSILVSGYELEEKDDIVQHFTKYGEIADMAEDEVTPSIIFKFKTRLNAESAMNLGKVFHDRNLQLSWYTQNLPGKDEEDVVGEAGDVQPDDPEDDYTPPQEDYLPPGLVEHEDSLNKEETTQPENSGEDLGEEAGDAPADAEELNENLLDEEDEEEENEERSWKRRSNGEE